VELKIGDVVMLKSGGPLMTVENIGDYGGKQKALCSWFHNNKHESDVFILPALEKQED